MFASAARSPTDKTVIAVLGSLGGVAMPRLIHRNPAYRLHRSTGQAIVTLDGKDFYLGPHNSKASLDAYDQLIS
jgi:hypothetical protein